MGSNSSQTVGYRYYMGAHLVLCEGPVDEVQEILVGQEPGREAWSGSLTASGQVQINEPDLFGGEQREGGIVGAVDVEFGDMAQGQNSYLQGVLSGALPSFRGVLGLVLRQVMVACNSPYFKPWAVTAKRTSGDGWLPSKADIGGDMNPAHIIHELITNSRWGMGYSSADIDDASFTDAANTLYIEGLGLSLLWTHNQGSEEFLHEILRHVNGSCYVDPETGLFVFKLIRRIGSTAGLLTFDELNCSLESFERPSWAEMVNQVSVVYHDRASDKDHTVTLADMAAVRIQGGVIAQTNQYPGISNKANAIAVCQRDLSQLSRPLAKLTITCQRSASALRVGDAFLWSWSELGIQNVQLRVASINQGGLENGQIRIDAVEDIFAQPAAVYAEPDDTAWIDPIQPPAPADAVHVSELPYWTIYRDLAQQNDQIMSGYADDTGFLSIQAAPPPGVYSPNYSQQVDAGAGYEDKGTGEWCPGGELATAVAEEDFTTVMLASPRNLETVQPGTYAYIEDEIVAVTAIVGSQVSLDRGVLDTVPVPHAVGTRLWCAEAAQGLDPTHYAQSEALAVKVLTRTPMGLLALAGATAANITMDARAIRPYPPGRVLINGVAWPSSISGEMTIAWAHRDRTQQIAYLVDQTAGDIGPEASTTYSIKVYGESGSLVHTETGLTGTSWTYAQATEISESGLGQLNSHLRIVLWAERSGWASWQVQVREFDRI